MVEDPLEIPEFLQRPEIVDREITQRDVNALTLLGYDEEAIAKMSWSQAQYRVILRRGPV